MPTMGRGDKRHSARASSPMVDRSSHDGDAKKAACLTCRKKKVKCSGTAPCQYCTRRGLECTIVQGRKRAYSVMRIEELESRLARYENERSSEHVATRSGDHAGSQPTINVQSPPSSHLTPAHSPGQSSGAVIAAPTTIPREQGNVDSPILEISPGSTIPADSALSSSHIFESRVQELIDDVHIRRRAGPAAAHGAANQLWRNQLALEQSYQPDLRQLSGLPDPEEAEKLLEAFGFYCTHAQCHFDTRRFLDRLTSFFDDRAQAMSQWDPWYFEMLLVFASGKLFLGSFDGESLLPGYQYFAFAQRHMPTLSKLRSMGALGVEITALMAVYLQNANQKDEAYLYISTALRLAVSHGYHRQSGSKHLKYSERIHINRLWWTIYMQERRIAAATGNPSGIQDNVIELDLPTDCFGFVSAAPMRTSIKLARVTGKIISVLYGHEIQTETTFVPNVQSIVQSLYEISKDIPAGKSGAMLEKVPEQSDDGRPSRTWSSLNMLFCQATILTIRPVMLHAAHLLLNGDATNQESINANSLGRLSRTCSEAARRLINVMSSLRKSHCLAIFGFFDSDAVFSAAFIMMLTTIFDRVCPEQAGHDAKQGLKDALALLQYLADRKNPFAAEKINEIQRIWKSLSQRLRGMNPLEQLVADDAELSGQIEGDPLANREQQAPEGSGNDFQQLDDGEGVMQVPLDPSLNVVGSGPHPGVPDLRNLGLGLNTMNTLVGEYYDYYYSLYNNPEWEFRGEDVGDFNDFSRNVLNFST